MPYIHHLTKEQAPLLSKTFYGEGTPSPLTATLAHVPTLLTQAMPFIGRSLGTSAIDFRTKEIVILRTSALQDCHFCVHTHAAVALKAKLSNPEIITLRWSDSPADVFASQREQSIIHWTDALASNPPRITPELREDQPEAPPEVCVRMRRTIHHMQQSTARQNREASRVGCGTMRGTMMTYLIW